MQAKTRNGRLVYPLTGQSSGMAVWKVVIPPERERRLRTHAGYEWLYVLSGEMRLILGEHDLVMRAGEVAEFDTRMPHWFGPTGDEPVEILSVHGTHGERMHVRAARAAPHATEHRLTPFPETATTLGVSLARRATSVASDRAPDYRSRKGGHAMPTSDRKTARLVGWLFIGTFVFSIPGFLLYGPLLDHPEYVLGAGHDTQITLGAFLEILTAICNIGTAVALYPLAKRYSPRAALGYVALAHRRVDDHRRRASSACCRSSPCASSSPARAPTPETFTVAGQTLVAFHDWTFLLGPGFCAGIGNGLLLGYVMYTSGLLPRRLAAFGLVAGSFAIVAATGALFGVYERQRPPQFLLTFPEMIWELTFGVYLIAKGFTPPRGDRTPKRGPLSHPPQRSSRSIAPYEALILLDRRRAIGASSTPGEATERGQGRREHRAQRALTDDATSTNLHESDL